MDIYVRGVYTNWIFIKMCSLCSLYEPPYSCAYICVNINIHLYYKYYKKFYYKL